ncbi:BURP domain-containing protein 17-like isoform X1 [Tripterygium wilfordii]|uniref:BURP domain-containing protein 17-like isoform X1 n=1 Tax=Tripterygium wilfordii TaxID=458696 RepID=A0A7J7CAE4_TRIWF|nr:protein RAFTIN 1B-like [Tripterygium wilfordii]KAF5730837.1 BURP domain-containing protein 17-like isoform X1 [Tripterygium wilfordii]
MAPHKMFVLLYLVFFKCGLMVHGDPHQNIQLNPSSSSHMSHGSLFIRFDEIHVGKIIKTKFDFLDPSKSSAHHFLPREVADSIPFSSSELPNILPLFSIPQGSRKSMVMEDTLFNCEHGVILEGEIRTCATSLESMLDFVSGLFGSRDAIRVLTNTHEPTSRGTSDEYVTVEVEEIPVLKMIGCHLMPYPYTIYGCHHLSNTKTKVFRVSVEGNEGDQVKIPVVCHMNTSTWDPNHEAFQTLNFKPGAAPVCHMFPEGDLAWIQPSKSV